MTVCIWWNYFTFLDEAPYENNLGTGQPYIYAHLPVLIGLTIIGIGLGRTVEEATHATVTAETRGLLAVGVTVWVFAAMVLKLVSLRSMPSGRIVLSVIVAACTIAIMIFGANMFPLVLLGVLVGIMVMFVVFEMRYWSAWSKTTQALSIRNERQIN